MHSCPSPTSEFSWSKTARIVRRDSRLQGSACWTEVSRGPRQPTVRAFRPDGANHLVSCHVAGCEMSPSLASCAVTRWPYAGRAAVLGRGWPTTDGWRCPFPIGEGFRTMSRSCSSQSTPGLGGANCCARGWRLRPEDREAGDSTEKGSECATPSLCSTDTSRCQCLQSARRKPQGRRRGHGQRCPTGSTPASMLLVW